MTDTLGDPRLMVASLLAETWVGFAARITPRLAGHGLDGAEFEVLLRLARMPDGSLRMTDLAAQTPLTSSGITRLIDRLVAAGSVRRRACTNDRRSSYAEITDDGRRRILRALPGHLDLIEHWLIGPLPADELAAFVATLRTLSDSLRPGADGAVMLSPRSAERAVAWPVVLPVATAAAGL